MFLVGQNVRYHLLHSSLSGPDLYYDVGTLITERRDRPDNWIYPSSFGSSNRCEHLSFISSIVRGLGQLPDAESLLRKASRPSPSSGYPQRLPHARVLNGCWRLPENLSENSVLMGVFVKCRGCPPNTPASLVTAYKAITSAIGRGQPTYSESACWTSTGVSSIVNQIHSLSPSGFQRWEFGLLGAMPVVTREYLVKWGFNGVAM